ncbi:uncharacterized protein ACWYII_025253 isoform 1-T2 [Salvelinus alpinus]
MLVFRCERFDQMSTILWGRCCCSHRQQSKEEGHIEDTHCVNQDKLSLQRNRPIQKPTLPGPSTNPALPGPSNIPVLPGSSTNLPGPSINPALPDPSNNPVLPGSSTNLPGPSTIPVLPGPSTNLPGPSTISALPGPSTNLPGPSTIPALPSTSSDTDLPSSYASTSSPLTSNVIADSGLPSPEDIWPYPKAGPRKPACKGRKWRKTILTDTPMKQALEMEKNKAQSSERLFPKKRK